MKTLLILRHAKSSWKDDSLPDHDRPLKKRGLKQAAEIGRLLGKQGLVPQRILCSTAERARRTAELAAAACGYRGGIDFRDALYSSDPATWLRLVAETGDRCERVLVAGHNPEVEELVQILTGEPVRMPTAALARVELPVEHWAEVSLSTRGRLALHHVPEED